MNSLVTECLRMGLCPRCLNIGFDTPLDMFSHCPKCDWQYEVRS